MKYIKKLVSITLATVWALVMMPFAMLYAACSLVSNTLEEEVNL